MKKHSFRAIIPYLKIYTGGKMPSLDWIGKKKVVNHHLDVQFRVLEKKYDFYAEGGK